MQTEDFANRSDLFMPDYAYFSSVSRSWLAHAERYAKEIIERLSLGPTSMVCEIAANDGYLLKNFVTTGVPCYGVEPTAGTAAAARSLGIEIIEAFFDEALANKLVQDGRSSDLLIANNVLAHVPDINGFVHGCAKLLKSTGTATFEFPSVIKMIEQCQFDTAYHEHFSYLSLTTVASLFEAHGMLVYDVEELTTHGGSLRVFAGLSNHFGNRMSDRTQALLRHEAQAGVKDRAFYDRFQARAEAVKNDLLSFLIDAKRAGLRVVAYGAAAKGNTLLNYAGIRPDLLPFVVDRAASKQGKFLPGSRIPIVSESRLQDEQPDYVLVLPWNLRSEVMEQLGYVRQWGGRFVTAVPALQVL